MKRIRKSPNSPGPVLAFGAHPDDIEFACGAIIAAEARGGRRVHLVVCSRGESASQGTPAQRVREAKKGAAILGATLEFVELDGDGHLEIRADHAIKLARVIRQVRPQIVLAPTVADNQHPDHARLGRLVRDAARLARFGGLKELKGISPHAIDQLLFYALTPEAQPRDAMPLLVDVSDPGIIATWTAAMEAHATQTRAREYVQLQLAQARVRGLSAGVEYAVALFPGDPVVIGSLAEIGRGARRF